MSIYDPVARWIILSTASAMHAVAAVAAERFLRASTALISRDGRAVGSVEAAATSRAAVSIGPA
jgi:hypothetical protein